MVRTAATSTEALATGFAVAQALGKTAVGVTDRPGFVVNRLLLRMLADVAATVEDGTPVEVADRALDPLGLPMRPFRLLDLVGLPVALHVLDTLRTELGDRFPRSPGLERLRDARARLARRDGTVDPAVQEAFGAGPGPLDEAGVRRRVLDGLAHEVGTMLDEGVVADVRQIDVCMVLGAGWPIANGGIAPLLDRSGTSQRVLGRRLLPPGVADVERETAAPGPETITVVDLPDEGRFEARSSTGRTAGILTYQRDGERLVLTSTEVSPDFGGKGVGTELVRTALETARTAGAVVVPLCPFVRATLRRRAPERADLRIEWPPED